MLKNIDFKQVDWVPTIFLLVTPPLAIILGINYVLNYGFDWQLGALTIFFYYACGMCITAGYHRLFSHCSYHTNNFVKGMLLFFGAGNFQHSALNWCTGHRLHHRFVDTDKDPYNAKRGFWYSHLLWMFIKNDVLSNEDGNRMNKDLRNDKLVRFQHDYYLPIAIINGFLLPFLIGLFFDRPFGALIFAGLVRMVLVHHFTYFINSLCHMFGTQNYGQENTAKDSWWISLLTYGEGYHNFHHHFQNDYRNGIRWYDFDPTKWLIYFLSLIGLADRLSVTSDAKIIKTQTNFDQLRIKEILNDKLEPLSLKVDQLKEKIDLCLSQYSNLQIEYKKMKRENSDKSRLYELKEELKKTKKELEIRYKHWKSTMISLNDLSINLSY